jgi:hypothetical protein
VDHAPNLNMTNMYWRNNLLSTKYFDKKGLFPVLVTGQIMMQYILQKKTMNIFGIFLLELLSAVEFLKPNLLQRMNCFY